MVQQKVVAAEHARRHNHVGVHRPVGQFEPLGQDGAPAFGFAAGILIADEERRADLVEKRFEGVVGMPAHHKPHAALGRVLGYVAKPLLQEVIVAKVRVGIVGNDREEHHHRKVEQIAGFDGHVERGIVDDAHGALHPVDDAAGAVAGRAWPADENTRLACQGGKLLGSDSRILSLAHVGRSVSEPD